MDFITAVVPHMGIAFERQNFLLDTIGEDHDFTFAMDTGKIVFNKKLSFSAQILGTESHYDQSWLWGWANEASGIPPNLLQAGNKLKSYGQKHQIDALMHAEFYLDEFHNGHFIGMMSSGLFKANAYYTIPYEGGALYVLIKDSSFPADRCDPLQRIALTFPQLIGNLTVPDHQQAFKYYVKAHNLTISSETDTKIIVAGSNNQQLMAQFDDRSRFTGLKGKLNS